MTDTQPEALRLAHALDGGKLIDDSTEWADTLHEAAAELRRLHARVQELERAVAAERDACLRLAERRHLDSPSAVEREWYQAACRGIAADIRARGAQGGSDADQT